VLQPLPHALTVVFTGAVIRLLRSACPVCGKLQTDWGQAFLLKATNMSTTLLTRLAQPLTCKRTFLRTAPR
jgi:hypothetical protein